MLPQIFQEHLRQNHLGSNALLGIFRRQSRQFVAGLFLICLGKHILHIPKDVGLAKERGFQFHNLSFPGVRYPSRSRIFAVSSSTRS